MQRLKAERPVALQAQREGEIQLVGRTPGSGLIELHWGVFAGEWLHRAAAVDDIGIRGRAVSVTIAGRPALMLAPEDAIIQLAAHLAVSHQMAAPGLRGLLDVALLARSQPVDWQAVAERARGWRVADRDLAGARPGRCAVRSAGRGGGNRRVAAAPDAAAGCCWAASSTPIPCWPAAI